MPKFKAVFKKRLLKLAEHLEKGKLGHKKFEFSTYNRDKDRFCGVKKPYSCGYAGCALGECPILFPKKWQFDIDGTPILRTSNAHNGEADGAVEAESFFGIKEVESYLLFVPAPVPAPWNKKFLPATATRKQVAAAIRRFVAWKENQPAA